jgi:preprotein translocase subunit SecA
MLSFGGFASRFFGSSNDRKVKPFRPNVAAINALEPEVSALTDEQLRHRTIEFREQLANGATLEDILVPAFATVREASKRSLGQRHFDVQLIGGMVLHQGDIAEMRTGEGKTLVATAPVYLNALAGRGVHVVTVNDYLAQRDAEWMGTVYRFLGLTVGCIVNELDDQQRHEAYACDVTYGTNNEFGFDYLRDNMKMRAAEMVQRGHAFAIVDEVDSILVDEARTPLIISGPVEDRADLYIAVDALIPKLHLTDFDLDEKQRQVSLSETGNEHIEELLRAQDMLKGDSLYDIENVTVVHHVTQALKAHKLFHRDKDYIVRNGQVVIIDEFTGRMMQGRRYSEGLHQALEAKERVDIQPENQTLASITFQNYFRLYDKLAGMTGTASTEADEFMDIYGLDVIEVPTNLDVARLDENDEVYRTLGEKSRAIVAEIADCYRRGQPVLVGTTSIEKSEQLSELLKDRTYIKGVATYMQGVADGLKPGKENELRAHLTETAEFMTKLAEKPSSEDPITHAVLNARFHEQEASIVAQAGVPGGVTIATNMAGRGTDIQLGGNVEYRLRDWMKSETEAARTPTDELIAAERQKIEADVAVKKQAALEAGGLYVIGTERHESRRIDNQLRGRSGRQGDPGRSKFYLSLEDDLMRIFGSNRMDGMLQKLGLQDGEAIVSSWINKALEKAQQKVEARNFDSRKHVLKYDDVMNDQRKVIFDQRIDMMANDDLSETVRDFRHQIVNELVSEHIPENAYSEQWKSTELKDEVLRVFGVDLPIPEWAAEEGIADREIRERMMTAIDQRAAEKEAEVGSENMRQIEKMVLLQTLDYLWREHLVTLEHLRQVIGFRAYGQRDPVNEYKSESFHMFEAMLVRLREATTGQLMHVELQPNEPVPSIDQIPVPETYAIHPTVISATSDELALVDAAIAAEGRPRPEATERKSPVVHSAALELDPEDPSTWGKVSRNAPCPCRSGKKFKHCHGKHD